MTVFRLTRHRYANDLAGVGGLHASGRCKKRGTPVIYTAQHVSLALVEVLVHMDMSDVPEDYVLVTIQVPDTVATRHATPEDALSASSRPPVPVFFVRSVVVPQEFNVVLYPQASGFAARITEVEPFKFDERLLGVSKNP